ncbi:MAG: hypothetical protein ACREPR_15000, partial [Brasilonema sp.]
MKVSELAQKLDLTLEEIKLILTAQRVKNVTEETEVPEAIATRILGTHKNVISLPQLQQATFMREPVGGQEELQEEFPGNNT